MPTYDYVCRGCEHAFELFQSMTEPVKRKCPSCGKAKLERLIGTGAAVLFKGGGFYETDYRSSSYKQAAEAEKKGAEAKSGEKAGAEPKAAKDAKAGKPDASRSESKPASAKPEGKAKAKTAGGA